MTNLVSRFEILELLDVEMSDADREELERAEQTLRSFLEWDFGGDLDEDNEGDVKDRLGEILQVVVPREETENDW